VTLLQLLEGWDNNFRIHRDFLSMNPLMDLLVQFFEGWTSFWQRVARVSFTPFFSHCLAPTFDPFNTAACGDANGCLALIHSLYNRQLPDREEEEEEEEED
jgi:hypothetical protein